MTVRYYRHRDGFNRSSEGASHVEVEPLLELYGKPIGIEVKITVVWPDGRRLLSKASCIQQPDVDSWVELGWWIELPGDPMCGEKATQQ